MIKVPELDLEITNIILISYCLNNLLFLSKKGKIKERY